MLLGKISWPLAFGCMLCNILAPTLPTSGHSKPLDLPGVIFDGQKAGQLPYIMSCYMQLAPTNGHSTFLELFLTGRFPSHNVFVICIRHFKVVDY